MRLLTLALALILTGCMSAEYTDGPTRLTIKKFCWESKIGHLEATDGTKRLTVDNLDSQSQAVELAREAVKLAASAAGAARP